MNMMITAKACMQHQVGKMRLLLNSQCDTIKFTCELEGNTVFGFDDVKIVASIDIGLYHKPLRNGMHQKWFEMPLPLLYKQCSAPKWMRLKVGKVISSHYMRNISARSSSAPPNWTRPISWRVEMECEVWLVFSFVSFSLYLIETTNVRKHQWGTPNEREKIEWKKVNNGTMNKSRIKRSYMLHTPTNKHNN